MAGRPKGLPKTGGRKKGSTNKVTKEIRESLAGVITFNAEKIQAKLDAIEDPKEWIDSYSKILPYVVAKKKEVEQRTEHTGVVQYFEIGGKKIPFE